MSGRVLSEYLSRCLPEAIQDLESCVAGPDVATKLWTACSSSPLIIDLRVEVRLGVALLDQIVQGYWAGSRGWSELCVAAPVVVARQVGAIQ